jgi:hypothetical protein
MYVVTNKDNIVLAGPIEWSPGIIINAIESETSENFSFLSSDYKKVPFEPIEGIKIRFAEINDPGYDSMFEDRTGPTWTFTETTGTANYSKKDKPIQFARSELKSMISSLRWRKENKIIDVKLKDIDLKISTERDKRSTFYQKYILLEEDSTVSFKINEQWLDLSKKDLKHIITKIDDHVQQVFDWELSLLNEIDNCSDVDQLKQVRDREIVNMREM